MWKTCSFFVILITIQILAHDLRGQLLENLTKDSLKNQKIAWRKLKKAISDHPNRNLVRSKLKKEWSFRAIPSYRITAAAANYGENDSITQYLAPNSKHPIEYVVVVDGIECVACTDCSLAVNFPESEDWYLDDLTGTLSPPSSGMLCAKAWSVLMQRKPRLIFSVRYIRNCWWFLEGKKFYIIDLDTAEIFEAEKFVRMKCGIQVIKNIAKGGQIIFCK